MRINAGTNVFGTPIDVFEAPFLGGITVIEAPLSEAVHRRRPDLLGGPDADEAERVLEPSRGIARRRLRGRLDGRRAPSRSRTPSHHAWLEGDHGLLRQLIRPDRSRPRKPAPIGRPPEAAPTQARRNSVVIAISSTVIRPSWRPRRPNSATPSRPIPARRIAAADRPGQPLRPGRPRRSRAHVAGDPGQGRRVPRPAGHGPPCRRADAGQTSRPPAPRRQRRGRRQDRGGLRNSPDVAAGPEGPPGLPSRGIHHDPSSRPMRTSRSGPRPTSRPSARGTRCSPPGLGRRLQLASDPWTLTVGLGRFLSPSASRRGRWCGSTKPVGQRSVPGGDLLAIQAVSARDRNHAPTQGPGRPASGQPPVPLGRPDSGVEFVDQDPRAADRQLASFDLDHRLGVDDYGSLGRRSVGPPTTRIQLREADRADGPRPAVPGPEPAVRQGPSDTPDDWYAAKARIAKAELAEVLDRLTLKWNAARTSPARSEAPTTRFSTRLSR